MTGGGIFGLLLLGLSLLSAPALAVGGGQTPERERLESLQQAVAAHYAEGRYRQALPLANQALALSERIHGRFSAGTARSLEQLADLLRQLRRFSQAEPLYHRTIAIREATFGPGHPALAATLVRYAALLRRTGRDDEANLLIARARDISGIAGGGRQPLVPVGAGLVLVGVSLAVGLALYWITSRRRPTAAEAPAAVRAPPLPLASCGRPRPWIRFWARLLDVAGVSLFVALGLHLAKPLVVLPGVGERSVAAGVALLLAWVPFEAMLLAAWGATPGKRLLAIRIERWDGGAVDFGTALGRSLAVWLKGLGCGLPLISLVVMAIAWHRLRHEGQTPWDREGGFRVVHDDIGLGRGILAVLAFVAILLAWLAFAESLV